MINLLPKNEKIGVKNEYRLRVFAVTLFFISGVIFINLVLLAPSFILSSVEYSSASKQLSIEKVKLSNIEGSIDPIKIAKGVNQNLEVLKKEGHSTPLAYDIFTVIIGYKPSNIKINSIIYDREPLVGKITVSGISKDRETLLSFVRALEGEEKFTFVDLPVSSFVDGKDIDFSVSLSIDKKK